MTAPLLPEVFARHGDHSPIDPPLAAEGVRRFVWESRFGTVLIEVEGERIFVNGALVERAESAPPPTSG